MPGCNVRESSQSFYRLIFEPSINAWAHRVWLTKDKIDTSPNYAFLPLRLLGGGGLCWSSTSPIKQRGTKGNVSVIR